MLKANKEESERDGGTLNPEQRRTDTGIPKTPDNRRFARLLARSPLRLYPFATCSCVIELPIDAPPPTSTYDETMAANEKISKPLDLILALNWSDGTTTWQDGINGPTEEMLDNTPDEKGNQDFLRPIEPFSKKETSWLCKMGGWLVEATDPAMYMKYKNRKICLTGLPQNYRLYEHVKLPGPVSPLAFDHLYLVSRISYLVSDLRF